MILTNREIIRKYLSLPLSPVGYKDLSSLNALACSTDPLRSPGRRAAACLPVDVLPPDTGYIKIFRTDNSVRSWHGTLEALEPPSSEDL